MKVGDRFQCKVDNELRDYEIVNIDHEEGWIKLKRDGGKGHFYLHKTIHRNFLEKVLNKKEEPIVKKESKTKQQKKTTTKRKWLVAKKTKRKRRSK